MISRSSFLVFVSRRLRLVLLTALTVCAVKVGAAALDVPDRNAPASARSAIPAESQ